MNRARRELDRLCAQARRDLGADVTRSVRRLGQVGVAGAKKHPFLVLAAGGLLAALAVARFRRPAPAVVDRPSRSRNLGGFARRLVRAGRLGLISWLSSMIAPTEKRESESPVESMPANGRTHE